MEEEDYTKLSVEDRCVHKVSLINAPNLERIKMQYYTFLKVSNVTSIFRSGKHE